MSGLELIQTASLAESKGVESVWVADHCFWRDSLSLLAAIAVNTKRVRIGTGVLNPYTRNPAMMATSIATIDELSGGRVILGIGSGVQKSIEQMGIKADRPLEAVADCVNILRTLLAGKEVTMNGYYGLRHLKLNFKPLREHVPIFIGAIGPHMLRLAGAIGDGILFPAGTSPKFAEYAIPIVRTAAEGVGRDFRKIDIAALVISSVHENSEKAKRALRLAIAYSVSGKVGMRSLLRSGVKFENSQLLSEIFEKIGPLDPERASKHVTNQMIEVLSASGTPAEFKARLEEYRKAGVRLPIVYPVPGESREGMKVMIEALSAET
jgi:5,10-methylenetetrahydromethanopterin reductase